MLTRKDKEEILENFLRIIEAISDKNYQRRVWIKGEGPEVDDFTETVCHFFDDGDPILKKYKEYYITEQQKKMLNKFRDEFEAFSDDNDFPEDFIDTPEWTRITEMAKQVLEAFNYPKKTAH